jgi:hypothetical protein
MALREFRARLYERLTVRADASFELSDATFCADHAVTSLVQLSLEPKFRRGHGALYGSPSAGRIVDERLFSLIAEVLPPLVDGAQALAWIAEHDAIEASDDGTGMRDLHPVAAGRGDVVPGYAEPGACPPSRTGVQPGDAGPLGQPATVWPSLGAQADAILHQHDNVPARLQDRRGRVITGRVAVKSGDADGEQVRAAPYEPFRRVCFPGSRLALDRRSMAWSARRSQR